VCRLSGFACGLTCHLQHVNTSHCILPATWDMALHVRATVFLVAELGWAAQAGFWQGQAAASTISTSSLRCCIWLLGICRCEQLWSV
jgi:hypothetical protein